MYTDYLIVGAGAQGLIIADELLTHTDAHILMVDRRDQVGGHWNDAYSFVRLHQPSVYYGVGSHPLGSGRIEAGGLNAGLYEQATGSDVLEHFGTAFRESLLTSGRVQFLGVHEYDGDWNEEHAVRSLVTNRRTEIEVSRAIVDTTWFGVETPETHRPGFSVAPGTPFTTPKRLPSEISGHRHVTVLGGGKTSMDVVIWLIGHGLPADQVCWVRPRDSWLTNRETAQPGDAGLLRMVESQANRIDASAAATSVRDLYLQMERRDELFRIDQSVFPEMFHGATISRGELAVLKQVEDVVRGQRVTSIQRGSMALSDEERVLPEDTLFVDCTARAFNFRPPQPVFEGRRITPKVIRDGLVSFSAAAIAYVEANYQNEDEKNALTLPIPYEEDLVTLPKRYLTDMITQERWSKEESLRRWARDSRLTGFGRPADDTAKAKLRELQIAMRDRRNAAVENLSRLIGDSS
ncbi:MAG: NAD(P)-binding protein [Pseudomonadota bacterium]